MKVLLINGQRVLLDDTYFPFTHKVVDLDEPTNLNLPITKDVNIPKHPINDVIFGYIGNITRVTTNLNNEEKVFLSFNQIKKCEYKLLYNSELLSEGLVEVIGVDESYYKVVLSDYLTEYFESDVKLNEIELINPLTNEPFKERCYKELIINMENTGVIPVFGDTEYTSNKIVCKNQNQQIIQHELPDDMKPIWLRSFKSYNHPFTTKLSNVLDAIENKINVKFLDRDDDVYMGLNTPKNKPFVEDIEINDTFSNVTPAIYEGDKLEYYHQIPLSNPCIDNGNYYFDCSVEWAFSTLQPTPYVNTLTTYKGITFNKQIDRGTKIGEFSAFLRVVHKLENGIPILASKWINYRIELLADINFTWDYIAGKNVFILNNHFIIKQDLLASAFDAEKSVPLQEPITDAFVEVYLYNVENSNDWDIDNILTSNTITKFTGLLNYSQPVDSPAYIGNIVDCRRKNLEEFRSGDWLTSEVLLPNIALKDFLINYIKTFKYHTEFRDGTLYVFRKNYTKRDNIVITDVKNMELDKIKFNKIKITCGKAESELISDYEKQEGKKWGEKLVYTGYSIRNKTKEITIPYSIPFYSKTYHYFGYDMFGRYYNGGYSRKATGSLIGLQDKLTFGYLNEVEDELFIGDDWVLLESKDYGGEEYGHVNTLLVYDENLTDSLKYRFIKTNHVALFNSKYMNKYKTLSPYLFEDNIIIKSLDISKMKYNYADIADYQYPESATMYERYYKPMIEEWYNLDNHVIEADILCFGKLDLYGIYNYMNSQYIIIDVPEWDKAEVPTLIEGVKLIRIKNIANYGG